MLTPTDVHYLVGLLTSVTSPDDVEVELGSRVIDADAEELRDVDVTVTARDSQGRRVAFSGIEVKDHTRRLDVTHIEQLCSKLNSMQDLSFRAIVSASGYTSPARRKAKKLGVSLFCLRLWDDTIQLFEHAEFDPHLMFRERVLNWAELPEVVFNPRQPRPQGVPLFLNDSTRVIGKSGKPHGDCGNLGDLKGRILTNVLAELKFHIEIQELGFGEKRPVSALIELSDTPCIILDEITYQVRQAEIVGDVMWVDSSHLPQVIVLVADGNSRPYVACALAEMSQGDLCGVTISEADENPHLIKIPVSDRNRNKIFQQRLR